MVMVHTWQQLLKDCKIDLLLYAYTELRLNPEAFELQAYEDTLNSWREYSCIQPRKIILSSEEFGGVYVIVTSGLESEGPAHTLLQEFNLCPEIAIKAGWCHFANHWLNLWQLNQMQYLERSATTIFDQLSQFLEMRTSFLRKFLIAPTT